MMIMQPDWITIDMVQQAKAKAAAKNGTAYDSFRFGAFAEGLKVKIMHVGPYAEEGPTIATLHDKFLPDNGLSENGHHHEIYLGDPRRTAREKLKTVLRQPVRRLK
jgi:hypothetical protein